MIESVARDTPWSRMRVVSVAVVGLLVAVLYAPVWWFVPGFGLDPSWQLGLSWAFDLGYSWGSDILFTYGPLGWVLNPMAFARDQIVIALVLHAVAVVLALAVADLLAREQLGLSRWPALLVAAAATALSLAAMHATLVLVVFSAIAVFVQPRWWLVVVTAISLAVLGQQKLTEAVIAAVFALLCTLGGMRWRGVLALLGLTAVAWVALWLLLGQAPGAIVDHVVNSFDLVAGFTAAQAKPRTGIMWQHAAAVALVLMLVWQAFEAGRSSGRWQRLCLVVATALASYFMMRAGLTRHDDGHLVLFTGYVVVLGVALVLGTVRGRRHWVGLAALLVAFALQTWVLPGRDWLRPIDRTASLDSLARTASVLMDDRARDSLLDAARADLAEQYAISPDLVEALRGEQVTADPWDVSAVWAAGADWQPVPGILPINAYTPHLDRVNTEHLAREPRLVLQSRLGDAIDGRNPDWDTPAYRRLLYCDYTGTLATEDWWVLRPSDESRCGPVRNEGTFEVQAGEEVAVPSRPGAVTLATITPHVPIAQRLIGLLGLPAIETIDYGGTEWRWAFGERAEAHHPQRPDRAPLTQHVTIGALSDDLGQYTRFDHLRSDGRRVTARAYPDRFAFRTVTQRWAGPAAPPLMTTSGVSP